ncbi:MAG TPA: hypothetical protein VKE40_19855 [Gemmataceae bacterium]|nr:hypothetical protein [Gemmataceae bacterium]
MNEPEVRNAVRITLAVLARLAERTRTPADDLLLQILARNEERLTAAVLDLLTDPVQPPTPERVSAALAAVGIRA